jgi:hypothetical protein
MPETMRVRVDHPVSDLAETLEAESARAGLSAGQNPQWI